MMCRKADGWVSSPPINSSSVVIRLFSTPTILYRSVCTCVVTQTLQTLPADLHAWEHRSVEESLSNDMRADAGAAPMLVLVIEPAVMTTRLNPRAIATHSNRCFQQEAASGIKNIYLGR